MESVEILLPNNLPHGFDYAVPPSVTLAPGDFVRAPFGSRDLPGIVWGEGAPERKTAKLKAVAEHYAHLPPLSAPMREFLAWVAWYTLSPLGAVLKMALPIPDALKPEGARERNPLTRQATQAPCEVTLSPEQAVAADTLKNRLGQGFSVTLLDGITGSGKTEVYFEAVARAIEQDGQALVLLPEISLSVQWLERFQARFGFAPVVWHSGLPPGLRKHSWRAVAQGSARVVVGARSALFLPYRSLRLIVADEEHDASYKQEEGVIYHARDMAVARARFEKIPAMLVSATPSLETWHNVQTGKYRAVHLTARHAGAQLPDVALVDMRAAKLDRGAFLSAPLREALAGALASGHQSLLFLNRRGYAPLMLCRACGHRFQCPQCTAWLVLHRQSHPRLHCHHCGYHIPQPEKCPACQAEESLMACGPGVERIAEEVAGFLPQARVMVMASDSTETYQEMQARIQAMQSGAVDVLIGTQMVAKGHHFENLAVVGVVDADLGLAGGDLRAAERSWQLLHQISGRAGRAAVSGRVLVQSFQPGHPVMQALIGGDRARFLKLELAEREAGRMPPFTRLAALVVEGADEEATAAHARALARTAPRMADVQVLGPAQAPLYMLRSKYRHRLLVRAARNVNIQAVLTDWLAACRTPSTLRVKIDVDPQSFL